MRCYCNIVLYSLIGTITPCNIILYNAIFRCILSWDHLTLYNVILYYAILFCIIGWDYYDMQYYIYID